MTFTQIVNEVLERMSLSSPDARLRVENSVNRHYRRITSLLGLETTRVATVNATIGVGASMVEFEGIEKIDRLFDTTDPTVKRLLQELSLHRQRATAPGNSAASSWAMAIADAHTVTVLLDTVAQQTYSFQADGWVTRAEMSGDDEPVFPASFHDVLTWFALAEELLRKEKTQLASAYETKAETLLSDLRFHLADTHTRTLRQASHTDGRSLAGPSSSGGGAPHGGSSYTQTGDVTFDRPGVDVPPFFVADDNTGMVENLNADMVDGEHAADLHDLSQATGNLPVAALPALQTDRLLGRDAPGAGSPEELTVSDGLGFTGAGGIRVADLGITTAKLVDASVTTPKIADLNVTTAKIAARNVTYPKLPLLAANSLLGRGSAAGDGDPEPIQLGSGLLMSGTTLSGTGGGGGSGKPFVQWTAAGNRPPAAAFATLDTRNSHLVLDFDGVTDEEAIFEGVLPSGYANGGLIVSIWVGCTSAITGTMRWQAAFEAIPQATMDIDADSFAAFKDSGVAAPTTAGAFVRVDFTFANGAEIDNLGAPGAFRLKIRRDADGSTGTDDITSDAELFRVIVREP